MAPLIRQPTLVLTGADDPLIPVINARVSRLLPHSTLHVFDDRHLGLVTRADILAPRSVNSSAVTVPTFPLSRWYGGWADRRAVLIGAAEWESIQETLFWLSQPGIRETIAEAEGDITAGRTHGEDKIRAEFGVPKRDS